MHTGLGINGGRPPPMILRLGHECPSRQFRITRVVSLGVFACASSTGPMERSQS